MFFQIAQYWVMFWIVLAMAARIWRDSNIIRRQQQQMDYEREYAQYIIASYAQEVDALQVAYAEREALLLEYEAVAMQYEPYRYVPAAPTHNGNGKQAGQQPAGKRNKRNKRKAQQQPMWSN